MRLCADDHKAKRTRGLGEAHIERQEPNGAAAGSLGSSEVHRIKRTSPRHDADGGRASTGLPIERNDEQASPLPVEGVTRSPGVPPDAEILEEVPVVSCTNRGVAIDLVLDRPRENRSQFVFTTLPTGREGIF